MPLRETTTLLAVLLALSTPACGDRPEAPESSAEPAAREAPAAPATAERPPARTDTLLIEGMPEPMEMRLVRPEPWFPIPFSAYAPADMEPVVQRLPGDRASARFVAVFGGLRQPRAFLDVEVYGTGTTLGEARRDAEAYARERGDAVRRVAVGEHAGRVFRLTIEYPPEYGDGMAPRTAAIQESWRWADGSPLTAATP